MSEEELQIGDDVVKVGRMPAGGAFFSGVYQARFPAPGRHIEKHLRGYGRNQDGAVIDLLRLRAQRDMIKMLDQG